jgi:hypothetical protein
MIFPQRLGHERLASFPAMSPPMLYANRYVAQLYECLNHYMEVDHTHNDDVQILGEMVGQRPPRHLLLAHAVKPVVLLPLLHRPHQPRLHGAVRLYLHAGTTYTSSVLVKPSDISV